MKKIVLFYFSIFIFGCNVEPKNQESQSFFGEFLYYNDAAVLNTGQKIYGVVIDDDMFELYSYCEKLMRNQYDMVPVYIKGVVSKNNKEGWENLIKITSVDSLVNPRNSEIFKPN